jgi:hypothetical protein
VKFCTLTFKMCWYYHLSLHLAITITVQIAAPVPEIMDNPSSDGQVKVQVKLALCFTNYALRHKDLWRNWCIDPRFLDLGTNWGWVVGFTALDSLPPGKSSRYPLDRRLGVPQSRSGRYEKVKILYPTGTGTPTSQSSSPHSYDNRH